MRKNCWSIKISCSAANKQNKRFNGQNKQRRKQNRTVNRDNLTKKIKRIIGWISKWTNGPTEKSTNGRWINQRNKKKISLAIKSNKKKNCLQPCERFELATPRSHGQCSNHWANEATTLLFKIAKTNKQRKKQKTAVNRDTLTK